MKIGILISFLVLIGTNAICQVNSDTESIKKNTRALEIDETMPVFLNGGEKGLMKIITDSVRYPPAALKDKVGGIVKVKFTVDTNGNVVDINVIQSVREDIDQEAIRIISLLNGWKPGMQGDKKVNVVYMVPISFWPDKKSKKRYLKKMAEQRKSKM